jgi:hypothetical protein
VSLVDPGARESAPSCGHPVHVGDARVPLQAPGQPFAGLGPSNFGENAG